MPSYFQKIEVENVVSRVRGVRGIAQEIEVRPFGTNTTADDEIAKRALNSINWNTTVPNDAVQTKSRRAGSRCLARSSGNTKKSRHLMPSNA
ncbi:hypothetical protein [Pararhizobium sp. O133]|uniref:hypothetical protein n=1 Tax=Pararhizobium sp. O133 TaxID=3449278 RepID=UPI003F687441